MIICPSKVFSLTGGPAMPEYNNFAPVDATDLVNLVSGDFSYSLPLMTVPGPGLGFPLVLGYRAGVLTKQEATWTGLGWNLQAGAITRQVNQVPDDFKGDEIKESIKSGSIHGWYGSISYDGVTIGLSWDNINGTGGMVGYSYSFSNGVSLGGTIGFNGVYEGMGVTLGIAGGKGLGQTDLVAGAGASVGLHTKQGASVSGGVGLSLKGPDGLISHKSTSLSLASLGVSLSSTGGLNGSANLGVVASQQLSVKGNSHSSSTNITIPFYFYGYGEVRWGEWSQWVEGHGTNKYYGFLHEDKVGMGCQGNSGSGVNCTDNQNLVNKKMEFMGFKGAYPQPIASNAPEKPDHFAKLMAASPDVYSVETQGLAGVFRPNRQEDGEYLNNLESRRSSGIGQCDVPIVSFFTQCTRHTDYNRTSELEGTKNLHNQLERDDDIYWRFMDDFGGAEYTNPDLRDNPAEVSVQSKKILPYLDPQGKIRGFEITKEDGVKYIYSFVLRNLKEAKLAREQGGPVDVATEQFIPAYAYAWLLTAIKSPDYVDLHHAAGECDLDDPPCLPAEGDLGGWVLFSYGSGNSVGDNTGLNQKLDYNWRTPYIATPEQALRFLPSPYIKGLDETESKLGHGTYDNGYVWAISNSASEGIKEIAYLMKVETPTHTARFKLSERLDGKQSALTKVRRDPTEIVRDYDNDRVFVMKSGLIQGQQHTVRVRYNVQILRDQPASCNPGPAWDYYVERNDYNSSNIILKSLDEGLIERSGFKADPNFFGNCLNAPGPELCRSEGLRIEEIASLTKDVQATVVECPIVGDEPQNCLVLFENDVKVAEPFNYSSPVANDELELPNSVGYFREKSTNDYYANYCGHPPPSPLMNRHYAERQIEEVTFLSSPQVGAPLKKLDGISLFSKLDETREVSAVQFKYDYSLVPGTPNSAAPGSGKLTLRSIRTGVSSTGPWLPDHKFDYQSYNPTYQGTTTRYDFENQAGWDRWGYHCASCSNSDHEPDGTAAAWNLEQITMPSGGRIKVEYEPKLFHTTMVWENGSIVPKDLTDRTSGSGGLLPGATRTGEIIYESDIFPRPFKYPLGVNQGEATLRNRMNELIVDAQQKGRKIDHYDLRLRMSYLRVPNNQQHGFHEHGFLILTRRGADGTPITNTNPPIIAMVPITRAEMTSGTGSGQCVAASIYCSLDKTIPIPTEEYEKIRDIGFNLSVAGYMPNPCLQPGHCAIGEFCAECHERQGSGGYDDMVSWMMPREGGTWTHVQYDIQSWLTPRNSRIGGGVRVAKLSTVEPITGKANAVQYTYGDGVTPTLPATFGTFDDRTLNNQPFLPLNVGYENFVGSPGVIYDKVSTLYTPVSGSPFRTDYHFVTAKDLPTQFSAPTKYEQADVLTGSMDWTTSVSGVFIGAGMHSPNHIDLQAINDLVQGRGYKVDDYIFELKFSAINQATRWYTSLTQYVQDEYALHCHQSMGNPNRFLMFSNFGDNVNAINYVNPPQVWSATQLLPIYPINPDKVSRTTGAGCLDGSPPYQWPATGSAMNSMAWNGTKVEINGGWVKVSIPARLIERYQTVTGAPTLRLDPRLVRKDNWNTPRTGYAVQDFHLDYKVTVVSSPASTARHYFRVTIQDYSSLWGNLWKKEDFAAGSTTPVRTNLVKWGFNDGWISQTLNSSFASETRDGATIWTKRMTDPGTTKLLETYQEKDAEPFVKATVAAHKRYFGVTQNLASYRYFGNNCDAESRHTNSCTEDNVVTTQTIHQRFLPHVMENTTIQDGLASTTHSTFYDFMTGAPLKTRTINSDQSVSDVYTLPAHYQYPDMAARNQLTQPFSTVRYSYPSNAPSLTSEPLPSKAVAASYARWRPFNSGGPTYPYRKSEEMAWRNKAYSGATPAAFSLPDDRCPTGALPDGTAGAPGSQLCGDATVGLSNWISSGRNSVYDPFGHVTEFIKPDGSKIGHMYSNGGALQNAVALRAGPGEIFHTSFEFDRDLLPHYHWEGITTTFLLAGSAAKTGSKGLLVQNSSGLENGVCFKVPPLQKGRPYTASVWYYDSKSGADHTDPNALRAGVSIGQPGGCHAEYYPDGFGGQPPANPNQPSRATGSKTWKKLEVSLTCSDPGYDPSRLKVCVYASRSGTGSDVLYDELRILPKDAMMSTFTYDLHGNMVAGVDPNGLTTRYEYDAFGNLTAIRNDDGLLLGSSAQQLGRAGK